MKSFLVLMTFLFSWNALWAQTDISPAVSAALKMGDSGALAAHFMPQLELTLAGKDGLVEKGQAQQMLAVFFKENPPQAFSIKHQGTSKLDDQFRIGELTTAKGMYRVTFFMKKNNNVLQIKQLKIEPAS
jgi:hypothetical protein